MPGGSFSQLVVVGSSAGGIGALSKIVSELPEGLPAPVVIAQHLDPKTESHLRQILQKRSALPVRTVSDEEPLEDGVIFVVPADQHVNITDSHIGMRTRNTLGRPKPSVDLLLESAAEVFEERLIAVVLTGTGTDGTDGARVVSERGGTVVVQNPSTAEYAGMPASLAPNTVDIIADLDEIGRILVDLLAGLGAGTEPTEGEAKELKRLLDDLRKAHGVDFSSYKETTIMRRLRGRMAATGQDSLGAYRRYLEDNPDEYRNLVSSFLIKVTEFFRDPACFEYLKGEVLPRLVEEAREGRRGLRIWSAGCATGEEAYSLAMALAEALGDEMGTFNVRIFATDVDADAVEFARQGVYPASSVRGLSEERLKRFFDERDDRYTVKQSVRNMIVFGEHDLSRRSPFPNIDLCVSRNVLIYFAPELQRHALQLFAYSVRNGGYLVLGKAETVHPLSEYFAAESRQYKVYKRQGERFLLPALPTPPPSPAPRRQGEPILAQAPDLVGLGRELRAGDRQARDAEEEVLGRLPVGAVVVDRRYDIRTINDAARHLLSIHGVAVGEDFLHSMQQAPYAEVRAALDDAFGGGEPASTGEICVEAAATGEPRYLRLDCYPQREAEDGARPVESVMVVVNDVTEGALERQGLAEQIEALKEEREDLERGAEAEASRLRAQNERLVDANRRFEEANRELGGLNDRLRRAYEEALMASEETQAATEEVETLNEELQATNEELETLNEELQATIEELNTTNEDLQARSAELQEMARDREEERRASERARIRLQAILRRTPFAIAVYEGPDLVLQLVNPAFLRLFGLREGDVLGKPFSESLPDRVWRDREGALRRVHETGEPFSEHLENLRYDRNGDGEEEETFLDVAGVPLRDARGEVEGVLVQLVDVTDQVLSRRRAEGLTAKAREEGSRLEAVLQGIVDAVLAVDAKGTMLFSNEVFRWTFGDGSVADRETGSGLGIFDPLTEGGEPMPPEEMPQVRAARGETFETRFAVRGGGGQRRLFEARSHPLPGEDEAGGGVIVIREVSGG